MAWVVHIGLPKTGTTSFQSALTYSADALMQREIFVPHSPFHGFTGPRQAVELSEIVLRQDLDTHVRAALPEVVLPSWRNHARSFVNSISTVTKKNLVLSSEYLSWVRTPEECLTLQNILGGKPLRIVLVLREARDFLRSYGEQLNHGGIPHSHHPDSVNYTSPDTWLIDYDKLIFVYRSIFGDQNLIILNYEKELREHGTVLPGLWEACGLPLSLLPHNGQIRENVTNSKSRNLKLRLVEENYRSFNLLEVKQNLYFAVPQNRGEVTAELLIDTSDDLLQANNLKDLKVLIDRTEG